MFSEFLYVTAYGLVALAITAILFRWLTSWAQGQGTVLGQGIRYGGSIAGYVLVIALLLIIRVAVSHRPTNVSIDGLWTMDYTREDGGQVSGEGRIAQEGGQRSFSITGGVVTEKDPGFVSFSTLSGTISGRSVVFVYRNSRGEEGNAQGQLTKDAPGYFVVSYRDTIDLNGDTKGLIAFTRKGK